ncbi:MAG: NAD-dependent epimerase/dehydratase family protein [Promethearchaeota archaeon]
MGKNGIVLVTGSNGFIGSHLVDALLEYEGVEVRGMVLEGTSEDLLENAKKRENFQVIYANMMDAARMEEILRGVDVVYHLAGYVSDWGPKKKFYSLILDATKIVTRAAIANKVRRIIYMSSLTVHGLKGHAGADETTPFDPVPFFPYADAKAKAEEYLIEKQAEGAIETIRVRPGFDIVGPRNVTSLYTMYEAIENGKFGTLNGGKKLICLVFVKNLVAGMIYVANHPDAAGEDFIIADVSWTWKKYVREISNRLNVKPPKLSVPYGVVAPFVFVIDSFAKAFRKKNPPVLTRYRIAVPRRDIDFKPDKIRALGFKAPYSFEEGLDQAAKWYFERKAKLEGK